MSTFLHIDINLVALLLVFMVFIIALRRLDQKDNLNKAYLLTLIIVFVLLAIESLTYTIHGQSDLYLRLLSLFFHMSLFLLGPILSSTWYLLVRQFVTARKKMHKNEQIITYIPVIINGILSLLSMFIPIYFVVDTSGIYSRGPLFFLSVSITNIYFILSLLFILTHRKKMILNELLLLVAFNVIPVIGAILQGVFSSILLAWSSAAFSLVIIYIYLQERLVHLDTLTGVWTRRSFDYYMDKRLKQKYIQTFGAIYFDVDKLKMINDKHGHAEGDQAIIDVITRIKGLIKYDEIIARLGGDEFIIVSNHATIDRLINLIKDIELSLSVFNENSDKSYQLSCSFGYGMYSEDFKTIDQFLRYIDHDMYINKHNNQEEAS